MNKNSFVFLFFLISKSNKRERECKMEKKTLFFLSINRMKCEGSSPYEPDPAPGRGWTPLIGGSEFDSASQ